MFRVNREIIQTMVHAYSRIFGNLKPVFDGRSNLYVKDPLPIGNDQVELEVTLDSEGKDRVFRVTIKWVAQVRNILQSGDLISSLTSHSRSLCSHWRRPWRAGPDRSRWTPSRRWTW